jgi:hypothetical protein
MFGLFPDCAEPVIGRALARPVGSIRATTLIVPDGQINKILSSPICKNISLRA